MNVQELLDMLTAWVESKPKVRGYDIEDAELRDLSIPIARFPLARQVRPTTRIEEAVVEDTRNLDCSHF